MLHGIECATYRTHQLGTVAAVNMCGRKFFKSANNWIVSHCSALHNHIFSEFGGIFELQNLIQAVFHHTVWKSCRNIGNRSPFAQHLFHFWIHKHGTACSQIAGSIGSTCGTGEIVNVIVERTCKCTDKRTAAGRTCFVYFYAVYYSVVHENGFHVLSAYIKDERNLGTYVFCGKIVGNGLYYSATQSECRPY